MKKLLLLLLTFSMVISLLVFLPGCAEVLPEPTDEEKELLDELFDGLLFGFNHGQTSVAADNPDPDRLVSALKSNSVHGGDLFEDLYERKNSHELFLWKYINMINMINELTSKYGYEHLGYEEILLYGKTKDLYFVLRSAEISEKMSKKQKKLFDEKSEAFLELYDEVMYEPIDDQTAVS